MKIFISWSGERAGAVAQAMADWLPDVLPEAEPWYSPDAPKGSEFFSELSAAIEEAVAGIVCVTPENQARPWLLFEAGALAKKFGTRPRVCTFLVGMTKVELGEPLNRYQATEATKEDTWRLVKTLNSAASPARAEDRVLRAFESFWPRLDEQLQRIPSSSGALTAQRRTDREVLEEVLLLLRDLRTTTTAASGPPRGMFAMSLDELNRQLTWDEELGRTAERVQELRDVLGRAKSTATGEGLPAFRRQIAREWANLMWLDATAHNEIGRLWVKTTRSLLQELAEASGVPRSDLERVRKVEGSDE